MIYLYPANKMENLLAIVEKIQQVSPLAIFSKEVFIVQNAGIGHWLNMSLAEQRGICFNIDYALPAQFLWKLLRTLVNGGSELEQTPFSREALCWRIYQLLASKNIVERQEFSAVNRYWQADNINNTANASYSEQENLKRYQLACQIADLYEQYLIFRPEWIDAWHQGELVTETNGSDAFHQTQQWQAILWQALIEEQAYNPIELIAQASANLTNYRHYLPKRISFFGINAMAPMWLSFIHALSEHIDVHFFHLNPCFSYWGDIVSEKQAIKLIEQWTEQGEDLSAAVGNPLLANLGQQGREFLALLQQYSAFNIDAFSSLPESDSSSDLSVLAAIQQDILTLTDARQAPQTLIDDSIVITSAHSTLREVQGVHDWLLHQFNQDCSLTPKDVLVMCPQVEQYAPYVNAVFAQGWQELDHHIPPLPCSIADRVSKESDPLVAAFSELLTLPDSRFQVSQILSWLRLPAMQQKFALTIEDIEKFSNWIEHACIHWGINLAHKQRVINSAVQSPQFTWQYGFSRLLEGFAYSFEAELYQDKLVLPDVEGQDAVLLGKLMLVIEQLQYFTLALTQARTPEQWQIFLLNLVDELFECQQSDELHGIVQAIESLVEYCLHADFDERISLAIVREFLDGHFSQPDPGRQFMVGQVTFCSMLPMRSIPFKIIAILGLNDGEFPRQRQPLGFDLMSLSASRLGDRSRRGDDRYLFLEAIISARKNLYLSYQGRNIRNNSEKQPSIVLKELMAYLAHGYGWQLTDDDQSDIRQLAMQPYSEQNYRGKYPSFDANWLAVGQTRHGQQQASCADFIVPLSMETSSAELSSFELSSLEISVQQLLSFYQHPSRYFAQRVLALYLDEQQEQLRDDEPFSCDHLTSYLFKQSLLEQFLMAEATADDSTAPSNDYEQTVIAHQCSRAKLSGKFPDLPHTEQLIEKLTQDSVALYRYISENSESSAQSHVISVELTLAGVPAQSIILTTKLQVIGEQLVYYRPSSVKVKDLMRQYLDLLVLQLWQQQQLIDDVAEEHKALYQVCTSHGYYFDTKRQKTMHYCYQKQENPQQALNALLEYFFLGQQQPLLLNGELAQKYFKAKAFEQTHLEQFWRDDYHSQAFGQDPYIAYFWQQCPSLADILPPIQQVYQAIFTQVTQVK